MSACPFRSPLKKGLGAASVLTAPNLLTGCRLGLTPLIVVLLCTQPPSFAFSFFLFFCAGLSDFFDGWIARRWHMTSESGAWLDPLADKILLMGTFGALAWIQVIPVSLITFIILRDCLILIGVALLKFSGRPFQIAPLWISKLNTLVQMALVMSALIIGAWGTSDPPLIGQNIFVQIGMGLTWVTTFLSGFAYGFQGWFLWNK